MAKEMKESKAAFDGMTENVTDGASREELESGVVKMPDTDSLRENPRWNWLSGFLGRSNGFDR